jgi:hypothetical protein
LDSPGVGDSFCQRDNRSISNIERLFSWQTFGTNLGISTSLLFFFYCFYDEKSELIVTEVTDHLIRAMISLFFWCMTC